MRRLLAVLAVTVFWSSQTAATVLVPADLGELAREARAIARGRVASVEARWTDDHRAIETIVTVDVDRYLKGALGDTLQFRVPGGQVGRLRSVFVGAPQFASGDRVIVFLGSRGPAIPYVLGLSQGVFHLISTAGGGWAVSPAPLMPSASTHVVTRGDSSRRAMALDEFEARVRELAAASPRGAQQ